MRVNLMGAAALAALALAASGGAARAEVQASGDPALFWNQVLAKGLTGPPVVQTRSYAMVSTAIYDSVNSTVGNPAGNFIQGVATQGGDTRAATAMAAYTVLVAVNPAKALDYAAARDASLALVPDGVAKTNGIATGTAIGNATLAFRANDGSSAASSYVPVGGVGHWVPIAPAVGPTAPQFADVTPWVMSSPDQFRPAPPPNIGSIAYAVAYNEVMSLGSATSATRTLDQTNAALFWGGTAGLQQWVQAGLDVVENAGLSTIENARLFALLNVAGADTAIAVWDSKFEYDLWRPLTAIHTDDGDPATPTDVNWASLIGNPSYPAYASGLSGLAGASSTVLAAFLGDNHNFCMTAIVNMAPTPKCFTSFSEAALDGASSRLWGGIHFRFDNETGLLMGQEVASFTIASTAFDVVPEPATWAMMITGFGLAGAMIRRRSRRTDFAAS